MAYKGCNILLNCLPIQEVYQKQKYNILGRELAAKNIVRHVKSNRYQYQQNKYKNRNKRQKKVCEL